MGDVRRVPRIYFEIEADGKTYGQCLYLPQLAHCRQPEAIDAIADVIGGMIALVTRQMDRDLERESTRSERRHF